jgi:hypothetical protein
MSSFESVHYPRGNEEFTRSDSSRFTPPSPNPTPLRQVPFVPAPNHAVVPHLTPSGQKRLLVDMIGEDEDYVLPDSPASYPIVSHPPQAGRGQDFITSPTPSFWPIAPLPPSRHSQHYVQPGRRVQHPTNFNHSSIQRRASSGSSASVISRMHSAQLPGEPFPCALLNGALEKELETNTFRLSARFIESLFPKDRLPFAVDEGLLDKLSAPGLQPAIWDAEKSRFRSLPTLSREGSVCAWLNTIGEAVGLIYERQVKRKWWDGNCDVALVGSPIRRKPDLVLLDCGYLDQVTKKSVDTDWAFARAFGEVTLQQQTPKRMIDTINAKSYLTFTCQPHRRFTIALSFYDSKAEKFTLTVTDRTGQVRVAGLHLRQFSVENALLFLLILVFLMFGSPEDIGFDPNCEVDPSTGKVIAINHQDRRFEIVQCIYALESLVGRATQVWVVTSDGEQYIMKDSWVQEDCVDSEVEHLRKMLSHDKIKGCVPTLVCGGDVYINGAKDSTSRYRTAFTPRHTFRVHRRLVTTPVGKPITSFRSKKEFIRVITSIIHSKPTYS